jgi:hypothetical protein
VTVPDRLSRSVCRIDSNSPPPRRACTSAAPCTGPVICVGPGVACGAGDDPPPQAPRTRLIATVPIAAGRLAFWPWCDLPAWIAADSVMETRCGDPRVVSARHGIFKKGFTGRRARRVASESWWRLGRRAAPGPMWWPLRSPRSACKTAEGTRTAGGCAAR